MLEGSFETAGLNSLLKVSQQRQTWRLDSQSLILASRQCSLPIRAHWLILMPTNKSPRVKAACRLKQRQQEMWINKSLSSSPLAKLRAAVTKIIIHCLAQISYLACVSLKCKSFECLAHADPLLKYYCHPSVVLSARDLSENLSHYHNFNCLFLQNRHSASAVADKDSALTNLSQKCQTLPCPL